MEITVSFTDNIVYIFKQGVYMYFGISRSLLQYLLNLNMLTLKWDLFFQAHAERLDFDVRITSTFVALVALAVTHNLNKLSNVCMVRGRLGLKGRHYL